MRMFSPGIIRLPRSSWGLSGVVDSKKCGGARFCVSSRLLYKRIKTNERFISAMEGLVHSVKRDRLFSKPVERQVKTNVQVWNHALESGRVMVSRSPMIISEIRLHRTV